MSSSLNSKIIICRSRFYEYHMTHYLYPQMRLDSLFAVEVMHPVMKRDSSPLIRPLTSYVETPSEIRSIFDSIAYDKGKLTLFGIYNVSKIFQFVAASVIRMFHHALSEETLRHGLQIYINKSTSNPEGITEPKHFYEALQLAVDDFSVHVANVFETWEFQAGYPILYVTRNYNGNNVIFAQKRFTDDIKNGAEHNE